MAAAPGLSSSVSVRIELTVQIHGFQSSVEGDSRKVEITVVGCWIWF